MCLNLLNMNFTQAFYSNQLCFILSLPIGGYIFYYIYSGYMGRDAKQIPTWIVYSALIATVVFGVLRNIAGFEYLRPLVM